MAQQDDDITFYRNLPPLSTVPGTTDPEDLNFWEWVNNEGVWEWTDGTPWDWI